MSSLRYRSEFLKIADFEIKKKVMSSNVMFVLFDTSSVGLFHELKKKKKIYFT